MRRLHEGLAEGLAHKTFNVLGMTTACLRLRHTNTTTDRMRCSNFLDKDRRELIVNKEKVFLLKSKASSGQHLMQLTAI